MLLLKLTLVPFIIALVALVGRFYSAKAAGLLSGLPVIAAPIIYFLYADYGVEFAINAAAATIVGIVALSSFCFIYAWAATRWHWSLCLLAALAGYFVLAFVLVQASLPLWAGLMLSVCCVAVHIRYSPLVRQPIDKIRSSSLEILLRMACGAILVLLISYGGGQLGEAYSGIFAAFPVGSSIITVFSHHYSPAHAQTCLKSLKWGMLSLMVFFLVLIISSDFVSFNLAFVIASLATFISSSLTFYINKRNKPAANLGYKVAQS